MSVDIKTLREKRAKCVADARVIMEGDVTAEIEAQFDALMAEADTLKARIDRMERVEASEAHLSERAAVTAAARGISADQARDEQVNEDAVFNRFLRVGMNALTAEERAIAVPAIQAAQSVGTNTAGGYTVPAGFYNQLEDALKAYGGMTEAGFIVDTETGNPLPIPTDNDTSNSGAILSENTQVSAQDVTFGNVNLGAYTYTSKLVLVSNQLLQDSAFDLNGFLSDKLGTRIARAINTHFTVGTGSSQPSGVVAGAVSGKVGTTGQTGSVIYDDLVDLVHAVDPAYRKGAKFMLSDTSLKVIKKLKDGQSRPLWLPGMASSEPDTILGYGYVINQDVASMTANAKSILFGEFKKYFIRRVKGTQVLRLTERYADYNQTGFLAFQRWDGVLVDAGTHPVAYYANSAS
jgi:HK97 family phage major capsid protein